MHKIFSFFLAIFLSITISSNIWASSFVIEDQPARPFEQNDLPNILKDWSKWSLDGKNNKNCDFAHDNFRDKYCYYISNLDIDINIKDVEFSQKVNVLEDGYILLPGSMEIFPSKVLVDNKEINVMSRSGGRPYVYLKKGIHTITGHATSKEEVRYLFIPNNATVINVSKLGKNIINPTIDGSGVLRLETQNTTKSETDDVSVFAYRKINDNIPIMMTLRLNLNVTGKERVENLGKIIPSNFSLMSINSTISTYVQKNGDLVAEVKPGYSYIDVILRQNNDSLSFVLDNSPVEQEIWVFESDKSRRVIQTPLTLSSVQTQNIPMPENWKRLPGYEINKGDKFTLKAINYDNKNLDVLNLNRNIKLAFDGSFYSIEDSINGEFKEDGRLSLKPPFKFYSAKINNESQAISLTSEDKNPGIEVRKGHSNINNVLRVERSVKNIPAAGYNREFSNVIWNLELAPGYKLFYASGVDTVSNSWISNWNLLGVFIVALLTVCLYYLFGFKKATLGFVLLVLLHPIFSKFTIVAFVLCGLLFLHRNIKPEQAMYKFISFMRYSLLAILLTVSFVFAIYHLRGAIYPILDTNMASDYMGLLSANFLVGFYTWSLFIYIIYKIFASKTRAMWRKIVYTLGILLLTSVLSSIYAIVINGIPFAASQRLNDTTAYDAPMISGYNDYAEEAIMMDYNAGVAYDEVVSELAAMPSSRRSAVKMAKNLNMSNRYIEQNANLKSKYQSINVTKNIAQTGVGFPNWRGYNSTINLFLKGPVTTEDAFRLYLMPPCLNILLAFLRVIFCIFVLYWLLDLKHTASSMSKKGKGMIKKLFVASILGIILLNPLSAKANDLIPSSEVIKKLEDKLSREYIPSCLPECVSIPDGKVFNVDNTVKIKVNIHSNEKLVVPLPVLRVDGSGFVKLEDIYINGQKTLNTLRKGDQIFALLNKGINNVEVNYTLDENSDRFILSSQIKINNMESEFKDLSFSENKSSIQTFQINRMKKVVGERKISELSKMDIDTFFNLQRTFQISTMWEVQTSITRKNNFQEAATIEVPLLDGEKVIDSDGTLSKNKIRISFAPGESVKNFSSMLPVEQDIKLKSPDKILNYQEEWIFNVDNTWSFKYVGMKPAVSNHSLLFKPNSGEVLDFKIFRPTNIDGYVITFDNVNYNVSYGKEVIDAKINLSLRASDAGLHDIIVPKDADIKELVVDGMQYPITLNDNKLTIPVVQGVNNIYFHASIRDKTGNYLKLPKFDLKAPAVNITQTAEVPTSKWVLFTSGPVKGPVVLFWSMIPAWLIIAFVLSRFKAAPVSFSQWFILFLGLTQTAFIAIIAIISWFIVVGIRDKFSEGLKFKKLFQVIIPVLSLIFIYCLFSGVYQGLLGTWTMKIVGNGSHMYDSFAKLVWYQDATMGALPTPKVISLPVWVYRIFMIIWSTWLSIYFVKWAKWGFGAYTKDDAWNSK